MKLDTTRLSGQKTDGIYIVPKGWHKNSFLFTRFTRYRLPFKKIIVKGGEKNAKNNLPM